MGGRFVGGGGRTNGRGPGSKLSQSGIRNRCTSELLLKMPLQLQAKRKASRTKPSGIRVGMRRKGLRMDPSMVSGGGSWHTRGSQSRLRARCRC